MLRLKRFNLSRSVNGGATDLGVALDVCHKRNTPPLLMVVGSVEEITSG